MFRMILHYIAGDGADTFEAQSFVEPLRSSIERRNAQKHIRMFAKNPLFDMFDKHRSNAVITPVGHDAEEMNVPAKWPTNVQQHETDNFFAVCRDVSFARPVHQWLDAMLVSTTESNPGFRRFEGANANLGFGFVAQAADENVGFLRHPN